MCVFWALLTIGIMSRLKVFWREFARFASGFTYSCKWWGVMALPPYQASTLFSNEHLDRGLPESTSEFRPCCSECATFNQISLPVRKDYWQFPPNYLFAPSFDRVDSLPITTSPQTPAHRHLYT